LGLGRLSRAQTAQLSGHRWESLGKDPPEGQRSFYLFLKIKCRKTSIRQDFLSWEDVLRLTAGPQGEVVTATIDVQERYIGYMFNGYNNGTAFYSVTTRAGMLPAIYLAPNQTVRINFGPSRYRCNIPLSLSFLCVCLLSSVRIDSSLHPLDICMETFESNCMFLFLASPHTHTLSLSLFL
jgi:hypothetical protein